METAAGPDPHLASRRPAGDVLLARATRTGRSPCAAATCTSCSSEELRRLDEDDVYAAVAKTLTRSRSL